jgi:hypothetical protein
MSRIIMLRALLLASALSAASRDDVPEQSPNTWVKRSPTPDAPVSPRMGYESSWGYDPRARMLIRWGGHNQGGGGEQNAETWTLDPRTWRWTLKEPNDAPPGVCCAQQNVFDLDGARFLRFPAFSGSHGWQWRREIALKNSSVWAYDLASDTWRDRRPVPEPALSPLRCASWDRDYGVAVVFGGEGNSEGTLVYDPYTNAWTRRQPPSQPPFRSGGNLAYDAARKLHILFGAQFTDDPHTWAYDLRANRWRDLKPDRHPPSAQNDAVLAYDSRSQSVVAVVKITEGEGDRAKHRLETWTFDAGRNSWMKADPPREPNPSGNRARMLAEVPELGLTVLENRTHPPQGPAEQQIWTYCPGGPGVDASHAPEPPAQVGVTTGADRATLTWTASSAAGVARYVISRGQGSQPWEAADREIGTVDASQTTYEDRGLRPGIISYYTVQAEDADGHRGPASARTRTQPRVVEDLVVAVRSTSRIELTWKPPPEARDVVGYHVERAPVEVLSEDQLVALKKRAPPLPEPSVGALRRIGAFVRLTDEPVREPRYADDVDLSRPRPIEGPPAWERRIPAEQLDEQGRPYRWAVFAYRVRAVNALVVEGGSSPYELTLPAAPQSLLAREQGDACDLRWAESRESGLKGYRVYRLDGRFDNQPVSRLTPEPITGTAFTDDRAGKGTRRYYVVAVDALGQEGLPSAPAWHAREWRRFYEPFVGEWHQ